MIEQTETWLLPKCFHCDQDIECLGGGTSIFEFVCGCSANRIETRQDYEIISQQSVVMQTLYFNNSMRREIVEWFDSTKGKYTVDLYRDLKSRIALENI